MPPGRLRGGVERAAFCSTLISDAAQSQQKLASAVQSQQRSLSFRLSPNCRHLDLAMWLRTSVPSCAQRRETAACVPCSERLGAAGGEGAEQGGLCCGSRQEQLPSDGSLVPLEEQC